mmetsp:Transcript_13873/g.28386  ORF Transcript_13873/g.28386 Transcript_13873/m.28386 type:complete len:289 (-) Transcript_13873:426-1292(-)
MGGEVLPRPSPQHSRPPLPRLRRVVPRHKRTPLPPGHRVVPGLARDVPSETLRRPDVRHGIPLPPLRCVDRPPPALPLPRALLLLHNLHGVPHPPRPGLLRAPVDRRLAQQERHRQDIPRFPAPPPLLPPRYRFRLRPHRLLPALPPPHPDPPLPHRVRRRGGRPLPRLCRLRERRRRLRWKRRVPSHEKGHRARRPQRQQTLRAGAAPVQVPQARALRPRRRGGERRRIGAKGRERRRGLEDFAVRVRVALLRGRRAGRERGEGTRGPARTAVEKWRPQWIRRRCTR